MVIINGEGKIDSIGEGEGGREREKLCRLEVGKGAHGLNEISITHSIMLNEYL